MTLSVWIGMYFRGCDMANDTFIATKEELYRFVEGLTERYDEKNEPEFTTSSISEKLNISRNLASQYLNEFVKEQVFVKVNSRPVYFFDKRTLEKKYEIRLEQTVFFSITELLEILHSGRVLKRGFEKGIGSHSRLRYSIEKMKSAITYPNNGLPVLLCGASGTGKSFLAECAYEYLQDQQMIPSYGKFYTFYCEEYRHTPQKALAALFGESLEADGTVKKGYLEKAEKGILCLDDVEYLCPDALEKLYHFMDAGVFQRIGGERWIKADTRLIFTTKKEDVEENITKNLLHRIPVVIQLPLLSERTLEERRRFLLMFFKEEAKRTSLEFFVSQKTFDSMLGGKYPGNINQMRNYVKMTCANAIQMKEKEDSRVPIYFHHLPGAVIRTAKINKDYDEPDEHMIDIFHYKEESGILKVLDYYNKLLSEYKKYKNMETSMKDFIEQGKYLADLYYNYLAFEKSDSDTKIIAMEQVVGQILEELKETNHIYLPFNSSYVLSREIYMKDELGEKMLRWTEKNQKDVDGFCEFCSQNFEEEYRLAEFISQRMYMELELRLDSMSRLFLSFQIRKNNQTLHSGMTKGMILCHGYSTASSIADTVNRIAGTNIYTAFDLPYEISLADLQEHILNTAKRMTGYKNLVVLVDLGSLENVDTFLKQVSNINLSIINNVSTRLALFIAMEILKGTKLEDMLEAACKLCTSTYRIIVNRKREKAILFVSESGIAVASRFSELFLNSLPKKIEVKLLSYEYTYFLNDDNKTELAEQYDILFATGTINPGIQDTAFISMGDIMYFEKIGSVHKRLSPYLTEQEKEQFDKNLLKNFSLQNVVSYLTILNPVKVLEMVKEALEQLQSRLGTALKPKIIIGLYIHISCLLERLITKQPIETYKDITKFQEEQTGFIKNVQESFSNISRHYGIVIPIEEIAYIYDFIEYYDTLN